MSDSGCTENARAAVAVIRDCAERWDETPGEYLRRLDDQLPELDENELEYIEKNPLLDFAAGKELATRFCKLRRETKARQS